MDAALGAVQWVVGKALAPVADGVLEAWEASNNLGLNIEALKMELLGVQVTLETASGKQLSGPAMETLLQKLRDSAHDAEDLLDELDYFRIHDTLRGTYDAADEHAKGGIHSVMFHARHTAKAAGKTIGLSTRLSATSSVEPEEDGRQRVSCCAWPRAKQRARGNSSSTPNANQADEEVGGCMRKLGKLLLCSSSPHVHDDDSGKSTLYGVPQRDHSEETLKLEFNRVDVSVKMKHIVEQLQYVRKEVATSLQSCDRKIVPDTAQSRPITNHRSIEPKLYGRDRVVNNIIHDITKGKYCGRDLSVLPIVGPGGIGKTTMIQHIYHNQEVEKDFEVRIWVCVSLSFDLNKILEDIKKQIPRVEGEKEGRPEELIEQRLKSKRFLLVLDDIWNVSNEDDWKRLLLPLKTSEEKGNMILVTTRIPAIADLVKPTYHSIVLKGLKSEEFRKLFLAFVFDDEQCKKDHIFLLETGEKIMEKLKGSPLAAKTVGRLLRKNLSLPHWRRVLDSKEWEKQTGDNDIMPALKLSYVHLPFQLQQCFSYSALFPEDYHFKSNQLISLWIGLDILKDDAGNQTYEEIGLSNLSQLVTHGFFKEEETDGHPSYVMHDLLHDLALKVASRECLSLHRSNVTSVQIQPCIRHLSVIIDDVGDDSTLFGESFKSELRKLKTKLNVEHLETLMLFGKMDESFDSILCELFREATALRVLHLPELPCPVESILHNFSALVHLRYLCLGMERWSQMHLPLTISRWSQMHLPLTISRFYHLRILDLGLWHGSSDLPKDMSNLAKLCRFYTRSDELHSDICNVGKLKLLEELKVFQVKKHSKGFEPKQLEHLSELRELGISNLEKIHTREEAAEAKLMEKKYLQRLTLKWDSNVEPDVEALVLENLQPQRNLQELCIRGHGGPSCPTWMGDELAVEALQSLCLIGVSWKVFPSLGKIRDLRKLILKHIATMEEFVIEESFCRLVKLELVGLESFEKWVPGTAAHMFSCLQVLIIRDCPKLLEFPFSSHIIDPAEQDQNIDWLSNLQELKIENCPKFLLVARIPWTKTLRSVEIRDIKLLEKLNYSKSSSDGVELEIIGKEDLHSFDEVLASSIMTEIEWLRLEKCPPLELKHILLLTSLKTLRIESSAALVGPSGGQGDVEWQLPVERLEVWRLCGASGKELTELLSHLPRLSELEIQVCQEITQLVVGVDLRPATSAASEVEQEKEEDGVLHFPAHLSDSLRELVIEDCPELVLMDPPTVVGGGGLQALRSLQRLFINECPKFLSACSFSSPCCHLFPSSLQDLSLIQVEGMGTLEPLSNLTSLTLLHMYNCGEDLRCEGLWPLITTGGQLTELIVDGSPRFFSGLDPNPSRVLQDGEGEAEAEHHLQLPSPHLQQIHTDDAAGLLAAPICSLLSSSLTNLSLRRIREMERFSKEQEDALHLLASLQKLEIQFCRNLQHLPAGLHKLTNLERLEVSWCRDVRSLPKDGLPKSLQELDIRYCDNEELKQQCRGLAGTIPRIRL